VQEGADTVSTPEDPHPWTRRPGETPKGYEAFRLYLFQGKDRSLQRVHDETKISTGLIGRWSREHEWVSRTAAYDSYKVTARVDGEIDELTAVRSKHLDLASQLLDHLGRQLKSWPLKHEPSIRWTTAFTAAAKVQQTALTLRETTSNTDKEAMDRIMGILEKRAEG
jgi:hypothetical protein